MINKQDIINLVNDYDSLKANFNCAIHKKDMHPLLEHASKMWETNGNMPLHYFCQEFMHYGVSLPRQCGKSVFLKELTEYITINLGYELKLINKRAKTLCHPKGKVIILIDELQEALNPDSLRGLYQVNPPLVISLSTLKIV